MNTGAWFDSLSSGLLPKWLLLVAVISITNSVQVYLTTKFTARVYPGTATTSGPIGNYLKSLIKGSGSSSNARSGSSRGARASPPPAHSTHSKTPSNPLPPADEPVSSPEPTTRTITNAPSPNTAVTRARPVRSTTPATPFAARMFGNWTFLSGVIRAYCALNISDPLVYQLTIWTYVVVCFHYLVEVFVFDTTGPAAGRAILGPAIIGPASLVWMLLQWNNYVK